ncbi:hypothetical protein GGG16DRAFT_43182 [Schizophyllum commune]
MPPSPTPFLDELHAHITSAVKQLRGLLDDSLLADARPEALACVTTALEELHACEEIVEGQVLPDRSQAVITSDSDFFEEQPSFMPPSIPASPTDAHRCETGFLRVASHADEVPFPQPEDPCFTDDDLLDPEPDASDVGSDAGLLEESEEIIARELLAPDSFNASTSDIPSSPTGANQMSIADFDASKSAIFERIRIEDTDFGPDEPREDEDRADAELSRIVSEVEYDEQRPNGDTGADGSSEGHIVAQPDGTQQGSHVVVFTPFMLYPGLTPVKRIASLLRSVARRYGYASPLVTFLHGLTMLTPSVPRLLTRFVAGRSRKGRVVELVIPENLQLTTFVYCENLGDFYEQVTFNRILKPEVPTRNDTDLTEEDIRQAFEGPLDGQKLGLLDEAAIATLTNVLHSMDYILSSAREADVEHHYRRTNCEILAVCLRCLNILHYTRSGSSSADKDHEGETMRGVHASPDTEDVYHGKEVKSATEMKTVRSLKNGFFTILFRLHLKKGDFNLLRAQVTHCPGYAHRFIWPTQNVYMRVEEQIVVQVFTAMFYKKLRVYELSSSDRSIFFFRDSLESTTLYASRVYNTPDAASNDPSTPNCMTNLTRFAMRYIAANDLYDNVAELLPEVRKEHWDMVDEIRHGKGPLYGIDTRTGWKKTGRAFYRPNDPASAEDQQTEVQRTKLRG